MFQNKINYLYRIRHHIIVKSIICLFASIFPFFYSICLYRLGFIEKALIYFDRSYLGMSFPKFRQRLSHIKNFTKRGAKNFRQPSIPSYQFNNDVVFLYHFSLPDNKNGYVYRSMALLDHLAQKKLCLHIFTRLNYSVGKENYYQSDKKKDILFNRLYDTNLSRLHSDEYYTSSYANLVYRKLKKKIQLYMLVLII